LLFVERGADKRVNPIELFRWQLSKRNTQVIGYCPPTGAYGPKRLSPCSTYSSLSKIPH
jgi:hypothetical protein